jgi:transposase
MVFQESLPAVTEIADRLQRIASELRAHSSSWRLSPLVEALQALRGVQDTVAITPVATLGDLTRFATPRQLAACVGLIPSVHATGTARRLGSNTTAGNSHARRVLVEGAWAYRHPAQVSESLRKRLERLPQSIQDIAWKAQLRLCKRFRSLSARGKHPHIIVPAIARELVAFMWAIAREVRLSA